MKKAYEKPVVIVECFSLNTNIAGDCEKIVGNASKGTCGIPGSDGSFLFSSSVQGTSGCTFDWEALKGDDYDGFCYHTPTDKTNLFNS